MGRKSKKKGGKGARSNAARSQPSAPDKDKGAPPPGDPPPGASCWICLDEEPDDAGRPIVRDCSCRGSSAGFAHLSCLVQYAEQKCGYADQYTADPFWIEPFTMCPNCKQEYRSQLAIDLASACVDFVDQKQHDCTFRQMEALHFKLGMLVAYREYSTANVEECEGIAKKCLADIEQLSSDPRMFLLLPYFRELEADVFVVLGNLHFLGGRNEESRRKAVENFETAKERQDTFGLESDANLDARLAEAKASYEGKEVDFAARLKLIRLSYQSMVEQYGEGSTEAVNNGRDVVTALRDVYRGVEAERFLSKLATLCRQVHGPEHLLSKACDQTLQDLRVRKVAFMHGNRPRAFQALRYEDSGKKCIVQGPIEHPRDAEKEITWKLDTPVLPNFGTPVICHGLKSAPELNGKLGDVRGVGEGSAKGRLLVHLEGRKKPILVKRDNLRIAFDLPEPTTSAESG